MNLEQAIHQRWAADSELCALLPAGSFVTGRHSGDDLPYATLQRRENHTVLRTNAGDAVDGAAVLIHVWHDDYDAGKAIAEQVETVFHDSQFSLPPGGRTVQMRRESDSVDEHDGLWRFVLEFLVQIYLPSGG